MGGPVFSVEETNEGREFNALIRWENGVERRVSFFSSAPDAQRWIKAEAENWLKLRHGTPDFPQVEPTGGFVVEEDMETSALAA